jgi:ribosomal-protein-alanine N-acetyltransferase
VPLTVAALGPTDALALAQLVGDVLPHTWSAAALADELHRPDALVLGAWRTDALVGFVIVRAAHDEAELMLIGVLAAARRQRVAEALWRQALPWLAARAVTRVLLEVRAGNHGAQAFYTGLGFRPVGRRRGYYADPPDDAVVMAWTRDGEPG